MRLIFQTCLIRRWSCPLCCALFVLSAPLSHSAESYNVGSLSFSTENQSMWGTGSGVAPEEVSYSTSWSNSTTLGGVVGSANEHVLGTGGTIPNPQRATYDAALATCKATGTSESTCKNGRDAVTQTVCLPFIGCTTTTIVPAIPGLGNPPPATIPNPVPAQFVDTRTGSEATVSTTGSLGVSSSFGVNGGTVDTNFAFSGNLTIPRQIRPGEFFSLNPSFTMDTSEMVTRFPTLTGTITAKLSTAIDASAQACVLGAGCTESNSTLLDLNIEPEILEMNTPNLPPDEASLMGLDDLSFDATKITVFADFGLTGVTLSLPGFPRPPLALNLAEVRLDAPASDQGATGTLQDGKLLASSEFDDAVDVRADLDVQATATGLLPPAGTVSTVGPFTVRSDLIDVDIGPTVDITQDFELTPTLMVQLDLSGPVLIRQPGQSSTQTVTSITVPVDELPEIALLDSTPVQVIPTFFLEAKLNNVSELVFGLSFSYDALKGRLSLGLVSQEVCLACESQELGEVGRVSLFDNSFTLDGHEPIITAPFEMVTNRPPEFSFVPDDLNVEGDITGGASGSHSAIQAFLDSAVATDAEDDDSTLVIEYTPELPEAFALNSTSTFTFSVTDSFGDTTTAQSTVTVVDTTAPALELDDFAIVSETATGSPLPDDQGLISAWLDSVSVMDVVDDMPEIRFDAPDFLLLGMNTIVFTATDSSGNQSELEVEASIKAPFSLYAHNSIELESNVVVNSGMVAVETKTPGPWLSKEAQADIGKDSAILADAALLSDSVYLDKKAIVSNAFINNQYGTGIVNNANSYPDDLFFPLESLPIFETGLETIEVGCKDCPPSGTLLEAGNYDQLLVSKTRGKKKGKNKEDKEDKDNDEDEDKDEKSNNKVKPKTILYLSGGTYTFNSVDLDRDTELRIMAPSLILIRDTLMADKNVVIMPFGENDTSADEILLLVGGDDEVKGNSDKKYKPKTMAVEIGDHGVIQANVFAADGSIEIGLDSDIRGALIGDNIRIRKNTTIWFNGGL